MQSNPPSNNLWVGNLAADVTDADLMNLFSKYGPVDSATTYSVKSFAFVYFKRLEDAKAAREALQGTVLRGNALKIEFARPAKPCKSLWVGGIGPSVTKEELEEQFVRFGKIQEFRFLRDRNTAFVDYFRIEDATEAKKSLNGLRIGGDHIRVDYFRSNPSRREQLPDFRDAKDGMFLNKSLGMSGSPWTPQDLIGNYSDRPQYAFNRPQIFQSPGPKEGEQPSNILCVCYPSSVPIDEQMLHNAMILFGEIENIWSIPLKNYSFVEFRSVEEAKRAKEGLEGRLFNDPRIFIMYTSSDLASSKDQHGLHSGITVPRPGVLLNDIPVRPGQLDIFSPNNSAISHTFPGHLPPRGINGPDTLRRPLGPQGNFESLVQVSEFSDMAKLHKLQDSSSNILMGPPSRKRLSPAPHALASPTPAAKPSTRPVSGAWDVFDASLLQRESKRSRTGGPLATLDSSLEKMDDRWLGLDQYHGYVPQVDGGISVGPTSVRGIDDYSPGDARIVTGGSRRGDSKLDYIWRGVIAKGGTHVCRARCVPVEKGFGFEIPEVVNCSARTGLDMLAKHYGDAVGFSIIYFLPDSVEDFAPYTEFLRYLGAKDRAGVAKFDDGTTLFLVPPSDFLTDVLNIAGPERLYGVVLKFPHVSAGTSEHPHLAQQHYIDQPPMHPRTENIVIPQEERAQQNDYLRGLHKNQNPSSKLLGLSTSNSLSERALQPTSTASLSQSGVTLTPELIATLASFLPIKGNSTGAQPISGSSSLSNTLNTVATDSRHPQGWNHEQIKATEQSGHPLNAVGKQYNLQGQFLSLPHYSAASSTPSDPALGVNGISQIQYGTFNNTGLSDVPPTQETIFNAHTQGGQFPVSLQVNQHYQLDTPQETQHGFDQGTNAFGLHTSSVLQPTINPVSSSHQVHGSSVPQWNSGVPVAGENIGLEPHNQMQQLHSSHSGAVQGTPGVEVDKNERYRSTLQFAAGLLLQIQQQNSGPDATQRSSNH